MKKQITQLLAKEMDRKDFLRYTGSVLLTMIGVSGLLRTILQHETVHHHTVQGYGSSKYGG